MRKINQRLRITGFVSVLLVPWPLWAQDNSSVDGSRFGVIVAFGLPSSFRDDFKVFLDLEDEDRIDIRSRDFEIGAILRGRHLGGDWGISYVQKKYEDGSFTDTTEQFCESGRCFTFGQVQRLQGVQLRGMLIHKFAPFVTIKRRAQVGLTFAGGYAKARGTLERHQFSTTFGPGPVAQVETVETVSAKELFLDGTETIPLWKVEVTAAALIPGGMKVRVGGGLSFTNYPAASVTATYLFGAR